jgi:hypothetical protein
VFSMKSIFCCLAFLVVNATILGQETSSSLVQTDDLSTTGGRARVARKLDFERKWKSIEEVYSKAGLAQEKIRSLRQLDLQAFEEIEGGKRPDFLALKAKRREIVNPEEEQKIEIVRREHMAAGKTSGQSKKVDVSSNTQ